MDRERYTVRKSLTGFVLAGGASTRMGRDKTQISWGSGTLLTHAIERMRLISDDVRVVGRVEANNLPVPVLTDKLSDIGPLAGIHSALSHSRTDWNLILAVDLPLITPRMLVWLADLRLADESKTAIVPRVKSRLQPLCAVYHRGSLSEIEHALMRHESSIHRLLEQLNTRIIEEEQLIANGFSPEMFLNVNTPEDLEVARTLARTTHG